MSTLSGWDAARVQILIISNLMETTWIEIQINRKWLAAAAEEIVK